MKRDFNWDGEKIKETVSSEDKKHSTKDMLDGLDVTRGEIAKFEQTAIQLEQQVKSNEANIKKATAFATDLEKFEPKCEEIQKEKIKAIIETIHQECFDKAVKSSKLTIGRSPDAYDTRQKEQLPYLDYQKNLATHEKMAKKIANRMVRTHLFEQPIFDNPFKKD